MNKKILFVCHGNICRSPMAEMIMKELVRRRGLEDWFVIASCATSTEEIGNPVYPPARAELARHGVPCERRGARQLTRRDYEDYDLLIGMDSMNMRNMLRILGGDPQGKLHKLMDYTDRPGRDVADPWYSDRFDVCYEDILAGCEGLLAECVGGGSPPLRGTGRCGGDLIRQPFGLPPSPKGKVRLVAGK